MAEIKTSPQIKQIDCIRIRVADLEKGLSFYRDRLGLQLVWHTEGAVGLRLGDSGAEIVLTLENIPMEVDLLVESAESSAVWFAENGGKIILGPFETPIGNGYLVEDPWKNQFVLLDAAKGFLKTDAEGNILGNMTVAPDDK